MASCTPPGTPKKLQKKLATKYSTALLYNTGDVVALLSGLTLASCNPSNDNLVRYSTDITQTEEFEIQQRDDFTLVSDKMSCGYCDVEFKSRGEQTQHYKSDWHRYNLQRSIKGLNSVSESQFEELSGDISSISGSEDSNEDTDDNEDDTNMSTTEKMKKKVNDKMRHIRKTAESGSSESETESSVQVVLDDAGRRYPKLFFRSTDGDILSVYRCIVYHKKSPPANPNHLITMTTNLPQKMVWGVFMASGGHFAAAVFDKKDIVVHKTFHRYVVRAKRGTAQGSRDSHGNAPKSAGATLRRYNEAALKEEVVELIKTWKKELESCDLIFLRAPSFNKKLFFSGKPTPPFSKSDTRIRMIPFATKRPTFNEVRRVHEMLCSVECYGAESDIQDNVPLTPALTFRPETGHLEVTPVDDPSTSPKHKKQRDRSKLTASPLTTNQSIDQNCRPDKIGNKGLSVIDNLKTEDALSSSGASTASDSELVECMESLSTADLKMYDITKKPRAKKTRARKRRPSLKHQQSPDSNAFEEERYHLKNALYTACKVGDIETLQNLLAIFIEPETDQSNNDTNSKDTQGHSNGKGHIVVEGRLDKTQQGSSDVGHIGESCLDKTQQKSNSDETQGVQNSQGHLDNDNIIPETLRDSFQSDVEKHVDKRDTVSELDLKVPKGIAQSNTSSISDIDQTTTETDSVTSKSGLSLNIESNQSKSSPKRTKIRPKLAEEELLSPIVTAAILNEPIGDRKTTLLHIAAKEGHKNVVFALLESGADPAVKDRFGQTPYSYGEVKEIGVSFNSLLGQHYV